MGMMRSDQAAMPPGPWDRVLGAIRRGLRRTCPACGRGALFGGYVKVNAVCSGCATELAVFRSDDAPAYFTVAIVGHLVVPGALVLERMASPPLWLQMGLWLPLTLGLTLALLPRVKGAIVGVHWALDVRERGVEREGS